MSRKLRTLAVVALSYVTAVSAQPSAGGWGRPDIPYDGGFTFVRLRWTSGTYGGRVAGRGMNFWLHEFPRAEQNLMTVLKDFTLMMPTPMAASSSRSTIPTSSNIRLP